eukprot:15465629-Alexandrium_andersonii.AAC.1
MLASFPEEWASFQAAGCICDPRNRDGWHHGLPGQHSHWSELLALVFGPGWRTFLCDSTLTTWMQSASSFVIQ